MPIRTKEGNKQKRQKLHTNTEFFLSRLFNPHFAFRYVYELNSLLTIIRLQLECYEKLEYVKSFLEVK
jgi:hypothetical protein